MAFLTKCHQKKVFEDNKYIKLKDTDEDLFKDALPEITAITTVTTKKRKQEFVDDVRELESDEEGDDTSKAWKGFNFNDNKFGISLKDDVDDQGTTSPLSGLTRAIYEDDTDTQDTGGEVNGGVRVNAGVTSNDDDDTHEAVDMTQAQQSQGATHEAIPPPPAVLSLLSSALSSAEVTAAKSSAKKAEAAYAFIEAKAAEEGKSAAAAAAAAATKDTPKKGKSPGKSPRRKETARITATAPKPSDRQQRLIDAQKK